MIVSAIVAIDQNNAIGADNKLIWHLPADLKRFKNITTSHTIVMGRKTYDSIGKPLPNRTNIVITRNKNWQMQGTFAVKNLEEAIEIAKKNNETEIFIIGGGQIYTQYFNQIHKLYVTQIHQKFEANTYFPTINPENWQIIATVEGILDEKNTLKHTFITYQKIN